MKRNIFASIFIIIAFVCSCDTVKIKKEKDLSNFYDSNVIYDPIFGQFICGKIKGDDSEENYKIIAFDTTTYDTIRGYAFFIICFDNINNNKMNIESVELDLILLKNNRYITSENEEYKYYDSLLTQEMKKFVCWKLEGYEKFQYFKRNKIGVLFEINGIKKQN